MKVCLVNGSPHPHGCTNTALSLVGEALEQEGIQTEAFWIGSAPIGGCTVQLLTKFCRTKKAYISCAHWDVIWHTI